MDFILYVRVTVCLCAAVQLTIGQECSNITFPDSLDISESTPEGHVIWEINITDSAIDQWKLSRNDNFTFPYSSSNYQLSLATKIVVECQKERNFKLEFACGAQKKEMNISVKYLDRYQPQWTTSKVKNNLKVLESDLPGTVVLDLGEAVQDTDCYTGGNHIEVVPYTAITQLDASDQFAYNITSKQVYLSRSFDYDERYCTSVFKNVHGLLYFNLRVYSEDNVQFSSLLTRNVTFTDVDDEPPIFLKSKDCDQCISVCKSTSHSHSVLLENDIQKNLTFDVFAKDFDTADADLEYIIVGVNLEFLWKYIGHDTGNGTVSLHLSTDILSSANETNTVESINIVLQAKDTLTNQTSDNFTLILVVKTPGVTDTVSADDGDLPVAVLIGIFVVVGVALMLFAIITIIRVRRTPNKTVYKVKAANSNNTDREVTEYVNMYDVNFILKDAGTVDTTGEVNNGLIGDEISETNHSTGNEANNLDADACEEHATDPEVFDQEEVTGPDEYHGFDIDDVICDENENNDEELHEVDEGY